MDSGHLVRHYLHRKSGDIRCGTEPMRLKSKVYCDRDLQVSGFLILGRYVNFEVEADLS